MTEETTVEPIKSEPSVEPAKSEPNKETVKVEPKVVKVEPEATKVEPKVELPPVASEVTKSALASELEELKAQVNRLAVASLMRDYKVPDKLAGLVPPDLTAAREFLNSEHYKELVADLDKVSALEAEKAALQAKLDALNHPQQVETTPVPDAKTEPAKSVPAKKWEDISTADLASMGSTLLNLL